MININNIIDHFNKLTIFNDIDDIPYIPIVDKNIYDTIIIPNLIRCGAIPKSELVIDAEYEGTCRNTSKAIWKGDNFEYRRYKNGSYYTDTINHFEDDDGYDVFVPIKKIIN